MPKDNQSHSIQRQLSYFGCMLAAMFLGLGSRQFGSALPTFLAENAGDAFWTALVYCGFSLPFPTAKIRWRALATIVFAYAIETSQLYHAPWIDSIRATTLGGLILGFQFVWEDFIRYAFGVAICIAVEWTISIWLAKRRTE